MNLSSLMPFLLSSFQSESELLKSIDKLSENFTIQRDQVSDYLADEKLVSAYTAFYLTTNYPKLRHIMQMLPHFIDRSEALEFIDVGSGPGTFAFALTDYFKGNPQTMIYGLETNPLMRRQANRIREGLYPHAPIKFLQGASEIPVKSSKRILLFTHSLNEMGNEKGLKYIKELNPDYVMLIEPGTKSFFEQFLVFREKLIRLEAEILYPCMGQGSCPMQGTQDWCHQYLKVKHELDVERLSQMAHKNRKWLPLTLALFKMHKSSRHNDQHGRIVRTYSSTKFSFEWDVCFLENGENKVNHFQAPFRSLNKADIKLYGDFLAGESIEFEIDKKLSDNQIRVKLKGLLVE
jgi:hypothetical protein